jgi:hypothetical protein
MWAGDERVQVAQWLLLLSYFSAASQAADPPLTNHTTGSNTLSATRSTQLDSEAKCAERSGPRERFATCEVHGTCHELPSLGSLRSAAPSAMADADGDTKHVAERLRPQRPDSRSPHGCSELRLLPAALQDYVRFHETAVRAAIQSSSGPPPRTLLISTVGGVGNQLNGIASALLLAILTRRVLFVDWPLGFQRELPPCFIQWDWTSAPPAWQALQRESFAAVDDCFVATDLTRRLERESLDAIFAAPHLSLRTNCPLYKHIASNAHYEDVVRALISRGGGGGGGGVLDETDTRITAGFAAYGLLLRSFLGLGRDAWTEAGVVMEQLDRERPVVGLQIRVGGSRDGWVDPPFFPEDKVEAFFRCANKVAAFLDPEERMNVTKGGSASEPLVFLSTDSVPTWRAARAFFGAERVISSPGQVQHTERSSRESTDHFRKAAVDLWVLARRSRELIVTPGSTFGGAAAQMSGRVPYYVSFEGHCLLTDLHNPPFRWGTKFPAL